MRAVDLKPMGFTVKINVPDSSIGVLDTMNTPTGVQIRVGNKYDVLVNTAGAEEQDLKKQQEIIKASVDVGETNFLVSDSTTLVWETKFGDLAQYHFFHLLIEFINLKSFIIQKFNLFFIFFFNSPEITKYEIIITFEYKKIN
jgi:hypothetical protein